MKKIIILYILIYVLVPHISLGAQSAHIKFGIDIKNSPPLLYQFDDPNFPLATGGLIYEVSVAIAEDLKQDYSILPLSNTKMTQDLRDGNIDLVCHSSLQGDPSLKEEFSWSNPLYTNSNVLVGKNEIPFKNLEQVPKDFLKDGSTSVEEKLKKLLDSQLDYIILSEVEFNYYKLTNPLLQKSSFAVDKTEIRCSLSKKSSLSLNKLNKTIAHLKNKKEFHKLHSRYLNPKTIPQPIAYGMNDNNSPPFLLLDDSTETPIIQGGLFFDLGIEMGKKLKRPIHFMLLARKRLDSGLADGEVELVCYNTEVWAGSYAHDYNWSIPIFRQYNLVVGLESTMKTFHLKSLKDLKGKTLGTTLGFIYPALIPYFKDGSIKREDALSGADNIAKLNSERVQYIVLNNLEYNYHKKKYANLQEAKFEIDPINVKCASSKKSDLKMNDINAAVKALNKAGRLQKVFLPH